jgi:general L-amino acid transport system substrate-binding protein
VPREPARQRCLRAAILAGALLVAWVGPSATASADQLQEVLRRGFVRCGVTESGAGFSFVDVRGERAGFEIDNCKTIAAALFGAIRVEYVVVNPQTVFTMIQSGGIDIFTGGSTWSLRRDASQGVDFTGVYFHDGQGFMVRRAVKATRAADLDGATICVTQGTTLEQNLADYFQAHRMRYEAVTYASAEMAVQGYRAKRCDALSMQRAALAVRRSAMPDPNDHVLLPDTISNEPQAAMVRQGEPRWRDLAFWAFNVRIVAEELGVTRANVGELRTHASSLELKRLLGLQGDLGKALGVGNDWAYDIIRHVGNFAEVWQRNFAPIGLERGANALWQDGGVMRSLPMR